MKTVILESKDYSQKAIKTYEQMGEVVLCDNLSREELLHVTKDADLIVGRLAHTFDAEFLQNAKQLKAIGTPTTGLDHIDKDQAKKQGINVYSLRGEQAYLESIAATPEHTLALLLSLLRKVPTAHTHVMNGGWDRNLFKGREVKGATIGIYGFGRVARLFSKFVQVMGAHVIAYDPHVDKRVMQDCGVKSVERDELFKQSNILMIHALLTPETENSIGEHELSLMHQGAYMINTARGKIVKEEELVEHLKTGHIAGVAVDVLADERDDGDWQGKSPLLQYAKQHENVIITPHIAGATLDSMESTENFIAKKCLRFMTGKKDDQDNKHFDEKWMEAITKRKGQEFTLYVPEDQKPRTQRQFNLYNYMEYIDQKILGKGFTSSLELGAGRGTISLYLRKRHGFDVTLNDVSDNAMELARANFQFFNEPAEFQVGDAAALPFPDNSFDVVTSIGLMEHLEDYTGIVQEAQRVLKPGGVMVQINIPKKRSIQILNTGYRKMLSVFGVSLRPDFPRNLDKPVDYARHTTEAGFENVETINVNPYPLFVPLPMFMDKGLTYIYRTTLSLRRLFKKYPFKTGYGLSQCHFLVGTKKEEELGIMNQELGMQQEEALVDLEAESKPEREKTTA